MPRTANIVIGWAMTPAMIMPTPTGLETNAANTICMTINENDVVLGPEILENLLILRE